MIMIEEAERDKNDEGQLKQIMLKLAQISKDCNEANRIVYEEYMLMQKIEILNGGLGWKINVANIN